MAEPARRRTAPVAEETSDVTRFRGVFWAAAACAVVVAVALVWSNGIGVLRSPGPVGRPHRLAKLECTSCHKGDAPATAACSSCHGSHASTRAGHQALRKKGALTCSSCHAIHRSEEGVAFLPSGRAVRFGTGWEEEVATTTAFRPIKPTTVPLVRAGACTGCHEAQPSDPLFDCLLAGQEGLGAERPTVCFDEHRDVTTIAGYGAKVAPGATTERDAAWEAARAEAAVRPRAGPVRGGALGRVAGWLGAGLATALVALMVPRGLRRLRNKRRASTKPVVLQAASVVRLPQIDATTCLGCYACVDACPYDVLEVRRYVAVVARPDDCCGLTLCEQRCPNGSLVVREGEPIEDRPRVSEALESEDVPGLYLAGDLTGLPLIRNAINQGAHAARAVAKSLASGERGGGLLDLVIVGAGPAGISAALEAKQQGLSALAVEQGSVAESIRSFPRGKLVFDQPLGMPIAGDLWLEESSKEELLSKWLRIVRREKLEVLEGVRVTRIDKSGELFVVSGAGRSEPIRARRVLLAVGRRGSPRKLEVPIAEAAEGRVFYSLADARSFARQRVVVVGLGDTAMETAIALAHQPETEVVVSYRGNGFRRGKARNIDEVRRLVERGRVRIVFESSIERIDEEHVELRTPSGRERIACDAVFVMIGSIPPWSFLESAGVRRRG